MRINRKPTSPGEILSEEYLKPLNLSQKKFADHIGCDVKVINRIVNERSAVTAAMAVKLGSALNTSPEFWMNLQLALDLYLASKNIRKKPKPILKASWIVQLAFALQEKILLAT